MIRLGQIKYGLKSLGKGFIASIFQIIGLMISGIFIGIFNLKNPPMLIQIDQNLVLLLTIPIAMATSITLGELFKKLNQSQKERFFSILLFNFFIQYLVQLLEQMIFTTLVNPSLILIVDIGQSIFLTIAITLLWKPEIENLSIKEEWSNFFSERSKIDWLWRIIIAWLIYVPIYYFVGMAISPIVLPYYTNPILTVTNGLVLPPQHIMIALQFLRGALFLIATLPIIILWQNTTKSLGFSIGLAIAVNIVVLLLNGYWLPWVLQVTHGTEITIDSFLQGFAYAYLLRKK